MLSQEIGIGQFLTERRKAGKEEPFFRLVAAGQKQDGTLTRQYILDIPEEITFLIHEELHVDALLFGNSIKSTSLRPFSSSNTLPTACMIRKQIFDTERRARTGYDRRVPIVEESN